ncbi:DUF4012 domain-containing protein [Amnibacterium sp.]|uniref:DUF4012 domain-containing protein n=1 Tax=Amnibacterium sp. TaxID=1872496 RepID=UPI002634FA24|nr:DUF4012 domain-containing protein [Amnibacterium sp.]MCU1473160.1 hypothetical protein [Amnibacterium sp.]
MAEGLRRPRRLRSPARRRLWIGGWIALAVGVVVLIATGAWLTSRVLTAKSALEAAQSDIATFKSSLGRSGGPSTAALYRRLDADTRRAVHASDDPVWSAYEGLPVLGPNLAAVRRVSTITHTLVVDGVGPIAVAADGLSVESLKPKNGRIDIGPLKQLTPAVARLDDAVRAADRSVSAVDTKPLAPQLAKPLGSLRSTLRQVEPLTGELRKVLPVLYPALGGDGPRHYLLMFQNNAEERASGGNPAALSMLVVDDGKVTLGTQPNSGDFPHPYPEPVVTFGGDWEHIYGAHVTTYETNTTFTPDFPQVATITRAMWRKQFGGTVDGVVSLDPVALSYLLKATGPIKLPTGETLTSGNAVRYLLSEVYARYPVPSEQDAVFASAAKAIFAAVTHGQGDPKAYVKQLKPMLDQQRLKAWSSRSVEEDLLLTSQMGNMLPADNAKATTVGVYNNDDSTSKMSYYMQDRIAVTAHVCAATPRWTVTTSITDTLKPSQVAGLPAYVSPNQKRIPPGGDRQWVQLYGPVGAKLVSATIDGKKVVWGTDQNWPLNTVPDATGMDVLRPAVKGVLFGRPVGTVSVTFAPQQTVRVTAVFTGGTAPSGTVAVSHTPRVWPVPVTITKAPCA